MVLRILPPFRAVSAGEALAVLQGCSSIVRTGRARCGDGFAERVFLDQRVTVEAAACGVRADAVRTKKPRLLPMRVLPGVPAPPAETLVPEHPRTGVGSFRRFVGCFPFRRGRLSARARSARDRRLFGQGPPRWSSAGSSGGLRVAPRFKLRFGERGAMTREATSGTPGCAKRRRVRTTGAGRRPSRTDVAVCRKQRLVFDRSGTAAYSASMAKRMLPIGISSLREIRRCYYVDKTDHARRLAEGGKY